MGITRYENGRTRYRAGAVTSQPVSGQLLSPGHRPQARPQPVDHLARAQAQRRRARRPEAGGLVVDRRTGRAPRKPRARARRQGLRLHHPGDEARPDQDRRGPARAVVPLDHLGPREGALRLLSSSALGPDLFRRFRRNSPPVEFEQAYHRQQYAVTYLTRDITPPDDPSRLFAAIRRGWGVPGERTLEPQVPVRRRDTPTPTRAGR